MKNKRLFILSFIIFFFFSGRFLLTYAQEASSAAQSPLPTPINYQLPYPGMLPDNPLYFLKVIRDNLMTFFISKPLDKAEFDLLQSDKNVQASYLLTQQQGKMDLALQTFSHAQSYFQDAIIQITNAKKQGYSIKVMANKIVSAHQKHMQIMHAIEQQDKKMHAQQVQNERNREESFAKLVRFLQ